MDMYLKLKTHLNDKQILRKVRNPKKFRNKLIVSTVYFIFLMVLSLGVLFLISKLFSEQILTISFYVILGIVFLKYINFILGVLTGYKLDINIFMQVIIFSIYSVVVKLQYSTVLSKNTKLKDLNLYTDLKEFSLTCKYVSKRVQNLIEGDFKSVIMLDILLADYIKNNNKNGIENLLSFKEDFELVEDTFRGIEAKNLDLSLYAEFIEAIRNLDFEITESLKELERLQRLQLEEFRKQEKEVTRKESIDIAERLSELKRFR